MLSFFSSLVLSRKIRYFIYKDLQKRTRAFGTASLGIKHSTKRFKKKIARTVMHVELQNKHKEKRNFTNTFSEDHQKLNKSVASIIYTTLLH